MQSAAPTSPHYADQTRLLSQKKWVNVPLRKRDIKKAPGLKVIRLRR